MDRPTEMNETIQIVRKAPGRVRIRAKSLLQTDNGDFSEYISELAEIPAIRRIHASAASGTMLIHYEPSVSSETRILDAVLGKRTTGRHNGASPRLTSLLDKLDRSNVVLSRCGTMLHCHRPGPLDRQALGRGSGGRITVDNEVGRALLGLRATIAKAKE